MPAKTYSQRLGVITDEQFQAALDRFNLGRFIKAEAIPFGMWGQNVFVSSSEGEYVLRGQPHFAWQFPTEQFYTQFLHEHTSVPVPWPYLLDTTTDIFGWSFVLMPRMPGLQIADPQVQKQLRPAERLGIARALGENLAHMQEATWPCCGRYNATTNKVEPFDLAHELAWPFAAESDAQLASIPPTIISHSERVQACLRHYMTRAHECDATAMTSQDIAWVEGYIADAQEALNDEFEPCLVMEDYKEDNLVVTQDGERWRVSGLFDLMEAYFGDGEVDLSRPIAEYFIVDPQLSRAFFSGYRSRKALRPGFAKRFPVYMLLDRALLWEFFLRNNMRWWDKRWTFRDWADRYVSPDIIF